MVKFNRKSPSEYSQYLQLSIFLKVYNITITICFSFTISNVFVASLTGKQILSCIHITLSPGINETIQTAKNILLFESTQPWFRYCHIAEHRPLFKIARTFLRLCAGSHPIIHSGRHKAGKWSKKRLETAP